MARDLRAGALRLGLVVALTAAGVAFGQQDRISGTEKGSLLLLPDVEVHWRNAPPFPVVQETFIHLTNDFPGEVRVKVFFVNGDPPVVCAAGRGCDRDHPGWNHLDNVIELTPNEPAYWAASSGLPKGVSPWSVLDSGPEGPGRVNPDDPGDRFIRGFIIAFAVDRVSGQEIRWNHLAADVTQVEFKTSRAWQYNGGAIQVVDPNVANGQETGTPGELNLDGAEYATPYSHLLMNFLATGSTGYAPRGESHVPVVMLDTDLTLLPVDNDFRQEGNGPATTKVIFDVWNANEVKFTNRDRCVTCWDEQLLSRHGNPNQFIVDLLQTDVGKARMDGVHSERCPGPDRTRGTGDDSVDAALVGVTVKLLELDDHLDATGANLVGLGLEAAVIHFDVQGPPPEGQRNPPALSRPREQDRPGAPGR